MNENYANWVKKLLLLNLFSPGSGPSWMDHRFLINRQFQGQTVGTLSREVITELRTQWVEKAASYLEKDEYTDEWKQSLHKDLEAIKWAGICLDRLVDYDANVVSAMDPPPRAPLEGDPASQENDEVGRGASLEPAGNLKDVQFEFSQVRDQAPQSAIFTIEEQSQPEPALPPAAPLSRAQDAGAPPEEPSTEQERGATIFTRNPLGDFEPASFVDGAIWLVGQCRAAYDRLEGETNPEVAARVIHAQRLAKSWAEEIKADQVVRDQLNAILVRSLRRLGQIRADYRKNGNLKRGKGGQQLDFGGLDKNTLRQSDKLAKIEEDDYFEQKLIQKLKAGELTKYSTLEDPPAPKAPPQFGLLFRLLKVISDDPVPYAEGKYKEENPHEWANIVMGGHREKIRMFFKKGLELLGPEN
jgi:hypothetical protein